jgi:hypothetical protein
MSRTIDNLKKLQERKINGYTETSSKQEESSPQYNSTHGHFAFKPSLIFASIFVVITLSLFAFNIKLLFFVKDMSLERAGTVTKLGKLEALLNENKKEMATIFSGIEQIQNKISQVEKDKDSQKFAVETLTKAKETLFKRMNELEGQLDKIKLNANGQK